MNAPRKNRDRFSTAPRLNERGQAIVAQYAGHLPGILRALAEHNILTVYDLNAILGGDLRSLRRSIENAKNKPNEFVRILPEQARRHSLTESLLYQLAPNGVALLQKHGHSASEPRRVYNAGHTGLVSHIMASIKAGVAQQEHARFVSWEELQNDPRFPATTRQMDDNTAIPHGKNTIRPDTHPFGLEITDNGKEKYRFLVVEADNGTETIYPTRPREYKGNSIYAKFEAYLDFINTDAFRARYRWPSYYVLFVFTNATRLANAMTLLASMGGSRNILFQLARTEAPAGYIFTNPCERAGDAPLYLNKAGGNRGNTATAD